jgi:predicted RNase H-like HicB family nuclease
LEIWPRLNRPGLLQGLRGCYALTMKLTAVFEPAKEGGYTCFVEEVPAAISEGETMEEAEKNLLEALKLVLQCYRELAENELSPNAVCQPIHLAET